MSLGEYLGAGSGITKGLYHLEDVNDSSGNAKTLTNTNTVGFVAGILKNCADFSTSDGHNKILSTTDTGTWANTSPTTLVCWAKIRTRPASTERVMMTWNRTAATAGLVGLRYSSTALIFYGGATAVSYSVDLGTTLWHLIVGTKASGATGACRLYVDGVLVAGPSNYSAASPSAAGKSIGNALNGTQGIATYVDEAIFDLSEWTASDVRKFYTFSKGRFGIQ